MALGPGTRTLSRPRAEVDRTTAATTGRVLLAAALLVHLAAELGLHVDWLGQYRPMLLPAWPLVDCVALLALAVVLVRELASRLAVATVITVVDTFALAATIGVLAWDSLPGVLPDCCGEVRAEALAYVVRVALSGALVFLSGLALLTSRSRSSGLMLASLLLLGVSDVVGMLTVLGPASALDGWALAVAAAGTVGAAATALLDERSLAVLPRGERLRPWLPALAPLLLCLVLGVWYLQHADHSDQVVAVSLISLLYAVLRVALATVAGGQLHAAAESAARAGERRRILAELHDTVRPEINRTTKALERAQVELRGANLEAATRLLDSSLDASRDADRRMARPMAELRMLVAGGEDALWRIVDRQLDRVSVTTGVRTVLHRSAPLPRMDPERLSALCRVVTEAVWNAAQHAAPDSITVTVERAGRSTDLTVTDDGTGFDPAAAEEGAGLRLMRERARYAGGTLLVESGAAGSAVRLRLPP